MMVTEPGSWLVIDRLALLEGQLTPHSPAGSTPTDNSPDWLATFIGPAVVAAVVTVVVGGAITFFSTRYKDRNAARLDLRLKALNEFYAPIRTLLGENRVLADALRAEVAAGSGSDWHALDHLEDIKGNPSALGVMKEIMAVNERIGQIIETKSGLDLGQTIHASAWQVHRRMLDHAFSDGAGDVKSELAYFPAEFEAEVVAMHQELVTEVKKSVGIGSSW